MQEELQRIKKKDYSQIDEKLFENMLRADNLTSTLSQLSQFQQFLMQQINTLNHDPNPATASLQNSINKNFDNLRQSLVHCSRIVCQNQAAATTASLKKKINSLQEQIIKTKKQVQKQMEQTCKSAKENAQTTCRYLLSTLERQVLLRKQLEQKCAQMTKERECLRRENEQLKKERNVDIKTSRLISENEPVNETLNSSAHVPNHMPKSQLSQVPGAQVLKERPTYNDFYSIPSFSQKQWKIAPIQRQNKFSTAARGSSANRNSLSRHSSTHQLPNKENLMLVKQNQALLSKGVREERRKSKQKIKIFSMM